MDIKDILQIKTGGQWLVNTINNRTIFCREMFSEEHNEIKNMISQFAQERIFPNVQNIEKLDEGASHTLRFNSQAEGGGEISADLDGKIHERKFGYFTPNLTDNYEIMLKDDGSIWINEGVDN